MNSYVDLKCRHQKEVGEFPMKFAFTDEQFRLGMRELGLDPDKDVKKVVGIPGGGFIRESDKQAFLSLFKRHSEEMDAAIAADTDGSGFICEMFRYELANHEYCVTYSLAETLDALNLTWEDIEKSPALQNGLQLAKRAYLAEAEEKGWG